MSSPVGPNFLRLTMIWEQRDQPISHETQDFAIRAGWITCPYCGAKIQRTTFITGHYQNCRSEMDEW